MRVLGRDLVWPFDDFWALYGPEVAVPVEVIEEGHSSVFGALGRDGSGDGPPPWATLPDDDLACHVAHELTHALMRERGYPRTGRGPDFPETSAEARVGGDLEEMVLHQCLDEMLAPFEFSQLVIQERMFRGAMNGLTSSPVPDQGTPWFFTWAIRYSELKLRMPDRYMGQLELVYRERAPSVCELGEELVDTMREIGWDSQEAALTAMIEVRDALGLGVDARVLVIDPLTGEVF